MRKLKSNECITITARRVKEDILPLKGKSGDTVIINVSPVNQNIQCVLTSCNYGGYRLWFKCPNDTCSRLVYKLYKSPVRNDFRCRICLNLTYESKFDPNYKRCPRSYHLIVEAKIQKMFSKVKMRYRSGKPTKRLMRAIKLEKSLYGFSLEEKRNRV